MFDHATRPSEVKQNVLSNTLMIAGPELLLRTVPLKLTVFPVSPPKPELLNVDPDVSSP